MYLVCFFVAFHAKHTELYPHHRSYMSPLPPSVLKGTLYPYNFKVYKREESPLPHKLYFAQSKAQ